MYIYEFVEACMDFRIIVFIYVTIKHVVYATIVTSRMA